MPHEAELAELLLFLRNPKEDVRAAAAAHLKSLSKDPHLLSLLSRRPELLAIVTTTGLKDVPLVAHDILSALINLAIAPEIQNALNNQDLIKGVLAIILDRESLLADLAAMLLANLTKNDRIASDLLRSASGDARLDDLTMTRLVEVFCRRRAHNPKADYHFVASILANVTLLPHGRQFFVMRNRELFKKIMPFVEDDNVIRRGGICTVIKNCCFEISEHEWLLNETDLMVTLLLPLAGPDEFDEEDSQDMPEELLLIEPSKKREPDEVIRRILLETLLLLTSTRNGRDYLRKHKAYPIIRQMHLVEKVDAVSEVAERFVDMLYRDEEPKPSMPHHTPAPSHTRDTSIEEL